ncbi:MAG: PLP-dependent aspartate aminotransferase family protein [Anaerolineae bacterium]|nr:PLP-dependent aspartate aminotransferase family protein [Anaerolineae bacterium]
MDKTTWKLATRAVHAGERPPRPTFTPVATPVYNSVAYVYPDMELLDQAFDDPAHGFVYSRHGNPTCAAFEAAVASLEEGEAAVSFASGMAAIHAALLAAGVHAGESVLAARDLYGATTALLSRFFTAQGAEVHFADFTDISTVRRMLNAVRPRALLLETVSNPLLRLADIGRIAELAHSVNATVIVDNTFATPCLVRPLELGADYVVHSATKYLSGHGDVVAGVVVSSAANCAALRDVAKTVGGILGPNEAYLALRGLKTLPLRVERQCKSAAWIAAWLEAHPKVARVYYPGLKSHPQYDLARNLFSGGLRGAIVSFEIVGAGRRRVFQFLQSLELCIPATTLGDLYTEALYPAHSSHRALTAEQRKAIGIGDGLVRLSVGIEDPEDIIADLRQALDKV